MYVILFEDLAESYLPDRRNETLKYSHHKKHIKTVHEDWYLDLQITNLIGFGRYDLIFTIGCQLPLLSKRIIFEKTYVSTCP